MNTQRRKWKSLAYSLLTAGLLLAAGPAAAHCDGLDGPVVQAARQALETGDVNRVLVWVKPEADAEVRAAFEAARRAKAADPKAAPRAQRQLYETLVRVHRAGEGEPYTGLKPAGRDLGPAIPAADRALVSGSLQPVLRLVPKESHPVVEERFREARARRAYAPDDVAAGRAYVQAYVEYIHTVEQLHATGGHGEAHGHAAKHSHAH